MSTRSAKWFVLVLVLVLGLALVPALADSPSQQSCETSGGTFTRVQGKVTCVIEDPVGNSENSGGHSQTTTDQESSNGTLQNQPHHQDSCTGPGGSGENGGPCHSN
jgi:hypothetical protein